MPNNGKWSQGRFEGWLRSHLRKISQKWPPIYETRTNARVDRGIYLCAGYKRKPHEVKGTLNKRNNIFVDHIIPIGSIKSWDTFINSLFSEHDNLQLLCKVCHDKKTKEEKATKEK